MENHADGASSITPKRRSETLPEVYFSPICERQNEMCDPQKRRAVVPVWVALLVINMLLLTVVSIWAVYRSHAREWQASGKCYEAPKVPGDRRRNKDQISIVNFNAEWLFMRGGHGDIRCPSESCPWTTKKEAMDHLKSVARVLEELDADIVNLNEIEDCEILEELLAQLPSNHGYRYYMVQGGDVATGQNPGILTRVDPVVNLKHSSSRVKYPVQGSTCKSSIVGSTGCTKHYITRFTPKNSQGRETAFVMAGVHLLAKPLDQNRCGRREGQAAVIKGLVEEFKQSGDRVVLAGDFNDYDSETIGTSGDYSITKVLPMLKSGLGLENTASRVPQNERYSCWFDKDQNCADTGEEEHTLIDHVLVSREWAVLEASFYHKYKVSCRERVSDHWPFKIVLDIS